MQNAAARLILGIKKREHITPGLIQLHWLPVQERILFKVLLLAYKALHDSGPAYLKELLSFQVPTRELRFSTDYYLLLPVYESECDPSKQKKDRNAQLAPVPIYHYDDTKNRAFGVCVPYEWNKLPQELKAKETVSSFKTALKTHLFRIAYEL